MDKKLNLKTSKIKKPSMAGEKLLTRICFYILAIIVFMLLGLINRDGPWRGFPIPWIFNMRHVLMRYFIPSLGIISMAVVGADLIAQMFIKLKEPKLKVHTKAPNLGSSYADTIEMSASDPDVRISATNDDINSKKSIVTQGARDPKSVEEAKARLKRFAEKNNNAKATDTEKNSGGKGILLIILFIIFFAIPLFDMFTETDDFYDDDTTWNEEVDTAEDALDNESYNLFEHLEASDAEWFSTFASDDEIADILEISEWNDAYGNFEKIYTYTSEEENIALCKYLVEDPYDDKSYIVAAKMALEYDEENELSSARTTGLQVAVSPAELDAYEYDNDVLIDYAKEILSTQKSAGDCKIGGASIIIWDPDKNIFGQSKVSILTGGTDAL